MPTGKQKAATKWAQEKTLQTCALKTEAQSSDTVLQELVNQFQAAQSQIIDLETAFADSEAKCTKLESALEKANTKLARFQAEALQWQHKYETTYHELCIQR